MNHLKNILVGIDYAAPSDNALREAARIAAWDAAQLVAVHVLDSEILKDLERVVDLDREAVLARGKVRLQAHAAGLLGAACQLRAEVVAGHPFEAFARVAEDCAADLVVLGSHGGASADTQRVGILAERCLRKLGQNVLLVRAHQGRPFRKVVVCIDFSETSQMAARQAVHIAKTDGAKLEFLHVRKPLNEMLAQPDFYTGMPAPLLPPDHEQTCAQELRGELAAMAEKLASEVGGLPHEVAVLEHSRPRAAIVDHVNQCHADLVVLGTRGHTTLKNLLIGSTAEQVLRDSRCSALAIKPHGFTYSLG